MAEIVQLLHYDPTAGLMQGVKLTALGQISIENVVDMRLDFTPPHQLNGLGALFIKMPQ